MATKIALLLATIAFAAAGCGSEATPAEQASPATTAPEASEPVTVTLNEVNDSGQSGTATLVFEKVGTIDTYTVSLVLEPLQDLPEMAHVHNVTCADYAKIEGIDNQLATVVSSLADVRDGTSESTAPGSIATGGYSINVHEPAAPFPAVACGDIPKQDLPR